MDQAAKTPVAQSEPTAEAYAASSYVLTKVGRCVSLTGDESRPEHPNKHAGKKPSFSQFGSDVLQDRLVICKQPKLLPPPLSHWLTRAKQNTSNCKQD